MQHTSDAPSGARVRLVDSPFNLAVIASGLGFFIDALDLFLFNVYRIPSLKEFGLAGAQLTQVGEKLLAVQMLGMMLGGVLSGVIADKIGRVSVLFASITLYSLANIANGMIYDVEFYALVRFAAGVGLAGELGAGVSLVSETMSVEKRGYGTILVATLGALGAVTAGLISDFIPWRSAFISAGVLGLGLLFLRMKSMESGMFRHAREQHVKRGSFILLFSKPRRAVSYVACILMGVPIWYSVGLLITLSPEIAALQHIDGLKLSTCFILFQSGITLGDLSSGILSQHFRTRKKIILAYMAFALLATLAHFIVIMNSASLLTTSFLMGLGCGYLSVFVTTTAEHFGTNLRVLVSASVTNFMRGAVTLLIPLHIWLERSFGLSLVESLAITGIIVWIFAFASALWLPDPYGKDLDYVES